MATLRERTVCQERQGTEVFTGDCTRVRKGWEVSGQRGGPLTQLGARRKLWGGMGQVCLFLQMCLEFILRVRHLC